MRETLKETSHELALSRRTVETIQRQLPRRADLDRVHGKGRRSVVSGPSLKAHLNQHNFVVPF